MDRTEAMQLLVEKAAQVLDAPDLGEKDAFTGRGADSLALVEFVMDVEDAAGVELTEAEVLAAGDLGALADVIAAKSA